MLTPPEPSDLKLRYPAFEVVGDAIVEAILAETVGLVDETWIAADRKPAMLAYAAHMLIAEGFAGTTMMFGGTSLSVSGPLNRVDVGDVKIGFGAGGASSSSSSGVDGSDLSSTVYGRRYLELLRRSHPAVLVA